MNFKRLAQSLIIVFGWHTLFACSNNEINRNDNTISLTPKISDIGRIRESQIQNIHFEIVNNSKRALHILAVAKSCSCSNVELSSRKIDSKGRITALVHFDPFGFHGEIIKSVYLRFSNGEISIFRFKAIVE